MTDAYPLPSRLLVAVGGNAIHPEGILGTVEEQKDYAAATGRALLPLLTLHNQLVITHGNGPVVGKILMRQAIARERVTPMSLDICVAHSQGGIAYLLMQALENALREDGNLRHVACLLTQVEVDPDNPAFLAPSKSVGYIYDAAEASALADETGWTMREDAGRGWRYVVPSPKPRHIADISLVRTLVDQGSVVIAGGGGGIPVVRGPKGMRRGIEAVIDKDLTSALMANLLGFDTMMILTAVSRVSIAFGTPGECPLERVSLSEIHRHLTDGQFAPGSMGPKIEAAIQFLEGGGKHAVIGHLKEAVPALMGETGTHIFADDA